MFFSRGKAKLSKLHFNSFGALHIPVGAIFYWLYSQITNPETDLVESLPTVRSGGVKNVVQSNNTVEQKAADTLATVDGVSHLFEGIASENTVPYSSDISQGWTPVKSGTPTSVPILTKDFTTEEGQKCARIQMDRAGATSNGDFVRVDDVIDATVGIGEVWVMSFRAKLNTGTSRDVRPYVNGSFPLYPSNITITDEWEDFEVLVTTTSTNGTWGLGLRATLGTSEDADILIQMDDTTQASGIKVAKESTASSFIYTNGAPVTRAVDDTRSPSSTSQVDDDHGISGTGTFAITGKYAGLETTDMIGTKFYASDGTLSAEITGAVAATSITVTGTVSTSDSMFMFYGAWLTAAAVKSFRPDSGPWVDAPLTDWQRDFVFIVKSTDMASNIWLAGCSVTDGNILRLNGPTTVTYEDAEASNIETVSVTVPSLSIGDILTITVKKDNTGNVTTLTAQGVSNTTTAANSSCLGIAEYWGAALFGNNASNQECVSYLVKSI